MKFIERLSRKSSQQPQPAEPGQAPLLMALEPRIMFDASVGVVAQDAAAQTTADAAKDSTSDSDTSTPAAAAETSSQQQGTQRHEVVFVDGQVSNVGQLLEGLPANAEVVVLDPDKDGLQQMADYLKGRENLDAIHLLSHGADGTVQLGNVWLASNNLAEHRAALESIGAALKADGDLMIYGCDVGQGDKGQAFLDELASITGADVAASLDDTGSAALGGNWTLERSSGTIETAALSVSGYDSLMAVAYSGVTVATAPVLGTTSNLMKYVVGDFNGDGRADILYQAAGASGAWSYAESNSNGTFTIYAQSSSIFNGLTLTDASTGGINYHAGDFNGDGRIDLLMAPISGPNMTLFLNNGSGFTGQTVAGPSFGTRTLVGDFNGDGALDILYQTAGSSSTWSLALNNGSSTPSFSTVTGISLPDFNAYNYKAADVDGDGWTDLIFVGGGVQMRYYRNNNGTFVDMTASSGLPTPSVTRAIVADFDGDGDADILYQTGANGSNFHYVRNDNGTFVDLDQASSPFAGVTLPDMSYSQFRVGDFDGDGDLDLFSPSSTTASSQIFYQSGSLPKLVSSTPADNSLTVVPSANITLTFDQAVSKGTGNIYIVRTSDNQIIQTIDVTTSAVTGSGTTWTIDPPADMVDGVAYAVRIDSKTFANANGQVYKGIQNNTALNFTVAAVAAPVISNLNGDTVSYTEGGTDTRIDQNGNATVTDADSANFNGGNVTVTISNNGVASEDVLWIVSDGNSAGQIGVSGNNISYGGVLIGTYTGGTLGSALVVSLNSAATPAAVTALLHNISYRNSNNIDPGTATRTVQVTINDGAGGTSAISSVALSVLSVNDAPTLTSTGSNPTYTEGGSAVQLYSGTIISTIESGQFINRIQVRVSDLANGSSEKLVVDGVDVNLTNGFGTTTINNNLGISVTVIGSVATVNITNASISVSAAQSIVDGLAYRNDSQNPSGATRTVTVFSVRDSGGTANGGVSMRSLTVVSTVSLVAVNNAPTLSGGPYSFTDTNEDTTTPGVLVSTVIAAATYADVDSGGLSGIAITNTGGSGTWQYSTDNTTWTDFGAISSSSALLLTSSTYVRYIPNGVNAESVGFTYRAWDRTSDSASVNGIRGLADTTANGGSTAFSTGTATASLTVTAVNDAPVLTPVAPTLTGLTDTAIVNNGNEVSDLTGGVTDVDTGALQGVAITSLTATYGKWQFSTDSGGTWQDIGTVSTSAALVLRSTDRVRFLPDGVNGETATITYKAWDRTTGTQGTKVDTTTSGGTSAFSTASDTASVTVTAVNDRPVLTPSGGNVSWTEGNNVTSTPVVVDPGVVVADPDGPNPSSAIVRVSNYYNGQDVLALVSNPATMGNIVSSWDPTTGTLTLTSAGNLATLAQFQEALRAVTYNNVSDAPTVVTRTVQFQVTDGGSLASVFVARNVTITSVDDSPTISAPVSLSVTEDVASVLDQIVIGDVDSTTANVTFSVASGSLGAIGGSGVTVGGSASALILSGSIVDINAFIAAGKLNYTTAANATANVTLGISVSNGSVSDASGSVTLQVAAVNDAPVVTVPVSIGVTEDVAGAVTGISFSDIDAGSGQVIATFSVPSGTLSAIGASGVVVGGDGTGTLTLSGTLADINAFIAGSNLSFKTAQDSTTNVVMTVSINDNGNTGGPAQTDSKTLTINVSAVNDAPVNNVPTAQTAQQNIALGFNTANGNAISITDVDAGNGLMTVTLTASNGLLTLGSLTGITMVSGTGVNDASMEFEGTRANINAALQTLSFKSASNFLGSASLTIQTNDNGNSGSGGAKTDTDVISITVVPVNPKVTSVSAQGIDRTVKIGDEVLINMSWDQVVNVDANGGSPSLLLETGLVDREAVYVSGSGSNTLVFKYTVQAGDLSADLDFQSAAALQLNGAVISNNTSDLAILTLPTVGGSDSLGGRSNIVVDGVVPVIGSVSAPVDGTYIPGQNLDFTVNFSENVIVDSTGGVPRIAVTLDTGGTVFAEYVSGSGGSALVFRLTVASGQLDSNGVTLGSTVQLNGGSIRDSAGNDTVVTLNAVASTANVNVDGVAPTVTSVTTPLDGNYKVGDVLTFTVNGSEALQIGALPPRLVLDVGGVTRYATYFSGSGGSALVFQYIVQAGDTDGDGIALNSIDLRGEQLTDLAGNDLNLTLNGVGSLGGVRVDTTAPSAVGIVTVDAPLNNKSTLSYTVTFDEDVNNVDIGDFQLVTSGSATASITGVTRVDGRTYTVTLSNVQGDGTLGLNLVNGASVTDLAGNAVSGGLTGALYTVDHTVPTTILVSPPSNGHVYVAGEDVDISVKLSEVVYVNGNPYLGIIIQSDAEHPIMVPATYLSGSGSDTLVFRFRVTEPMNDNDGILINSFLSLDGGSIRDAAGNDANTVLSGSGIWTGVKIDAVQPEIASVEVPAAGNYKLGDVLTFTVNPNEVVQLDTSTGTPLLVLSVAGVTRYATYTSSNGAGAMVFQYTVQPGENASGLSITSLDLNGASARDLAGNAMVLDIQGVGDTSGIVIDNTPPVFNGINQLTSSPTAAASVEYSVAFNEQVSGVDLSAFTLSFGGTLQGAIESITSTDGKTYVVKVSGLVGEGTARLALNVTNSIKDAAGNALRPVSDYSEYRVDRIDPTVASVSVPAAGTYVAGQNLEFTVTMDENIQMLTNGNTPTIEVNLGNGQTALATYVSQTGSRTLLFRMTVTSGQLDTDGITLGSSINLNGAVLRDSVRNNADTTLKGVGDTSGVLVDAVAPTVSGVTLPPAGAYQVGGVLRFDVAVSETVNVDTSTGVPRLVLDVGGVTRYATYVSGSGSSMLVFEYRVVAGDNANGIGVANSIDVNGSTLRDAAGNNLDPALNVPTGNSGVLIDTAPPVPLSIVADGAYQASDRSLSFTLTFSEAVTGVDAGDFTLLGTQSASGVVQSVQQIDARTYRIVIGNITGQGSLALNLNAAGSGIQDGLGNQLTESGASAAQVIPNQDIGDLEFRLNPPETLGLPQAPLVQPQVPGIVINESVSPLVPGSLFEIRTVGGDLKPLGTIFLGNAGSAPSFIAQVFGSSDSGLGNGGGEGFLGFGGGTGGIFGGSTFSNIFSRDVPGVSEMNVFSGSQWKQSDLNQGLRGVFGVPTFGQQLQQINEADQRQVRELAKALAKPAEIGQQA